MQFRESVTSGVRQPEMEKNDGHVYVRWDFVRSTIPATENEPEREEWKYKEYYMSDNEYNDVQVGRFSGTWDDALRSIQREHLYEYADKMISKYSTDVSDETKKQAWITYKAGVRATQNASGYPQQVSYPARPE